MSNSSLSAIGGGRSRPVRPRRSAALTLFEVAIASAILALVVVSAVLAFPVGLKAEQIARFQVIAGTKALEIATQWAHADHLFWERNCEVPDPALATFTAVQNDLDTMNDHGWFGLIQLPTALSRRFDSDDGEIAQLLADGAHLYYAPAHPAESGFDSRGITFTADALPVEAQTLVFGVIGYAQQNALPSHPCLAMPYYDSWPSPPQEWEAETWRINRATWPGWTEFQALYGNYHAADFAGRTGDPACIGRQVRLAVELAKAVGVDFDAVPVGGARDLPLDPLETPRLPAALPLQWSATDPEAFPPPYRVLALRYLAQAATAWTGSGIDAARSSPDRKPYPAENSFAQRTHDACLLWGMRFASGSPYDWGAPRPLNRQTCFDFPLLQADLASPPIAGGDGGADRAWRIVGADQPIDYGRGRGHYGWEPMADNHAAIDASWGDRRSFNLTARFRACDRCRQLVCWSVPWQAYEDAEIVPADPQDAKLHWLDSTGTPVRSLRVGFPAEYTASWRDASRGAGSTGDPHNQLPDWHDLYGPPPADGSLAPESRAQWMGLYGADRNGNGELDRGPLPASARLRAVTVARFNFYDKRLIGAIRD